MRVMLLLSFVLELESLALPIEFLVLPLVLIPDIFFCSFRSKIKQLLQAFA